VHQGQHLWALRLGQLLGLLLIEQDAEPSILPRLQLEIG
jgi:hypothetical protein